MSITVFQEGPDNLLTSLAKVKLTLGITNSDETYDELLEDFIKESSDFIENYTGRKFGLATVRESVVGNGLPDILLSRTPILEVLEVMLDETAYTDYTVYDKDAGILQRTLGWTSTNIRHDLISPHPSSYGEKRWHITYTGGYVLPSWMGSSGDRDLPYDLERACIELVKTDFYNRSRDGTITQYKQGETSVTWKQSSWDQERGELANLPSRAATVLAYYKRIK